MQDKWYNTKCKSYWSNQWSIENFNHYWRYWAKSTYRLFRVSIRYEVCSLWGSLSGQRSFKTMRTCFWGLASTDAFTKSTLLGTFTIYIGMNRFQTWCTHNSLTLYDELRPFPITLSACPFFKPVGTCLWEGVSTEVCTPEYYLYKGTKDRKTERSSPPAVSTGTIFFVMTLAVALFIWNEQVLYSVCSHTSKYRIHLIMTVRNL